VTEALSGISIEPFRGDLEGLEKMAHTSWRDEYGISSFPNFYRPAFLDCLFGRRERLSFIRTFLRYIREKECLGAIEWTKKYYPQGAFYRAHFFPYFRAVQMYSWTFNPEIALAGVRSSNEILV
jgi:hypothetical protein